LKVSKLVVPLGGLEVQREKKTKGKGRRGAGSVFNRDCCVNRGGQKRSRGGGTSA